QRIARVGGDELVQRAFRFAVITLLQQLDRVVVALLRRAWRQLALRRGRRRGLLLRRRGGARAGHPAGRQCPGLPARLGRGRRRRRGGTALLRARLRRTLFQRAEAEIDILDQLVETRLRLLVLIFHPLDAA